MSKNRCFTGSPVFKCVIFCKHRRKTLESNILYWLRLLLQVHYRTQSSAEFLFSFITLSLYHFFHHPFPFEVTKDMNYCIKSIQSCREIKVFVNIEPCTDNVHHNPCPPLFYIFTCQHPHAYDTEGSGERIKPGYTTVGETNEYPDYTDKSNGEYNAEGR